MKNTLKLSLLAMMALLMAACGTKEDPTPAPSPKPTEKDELKLTSQNAFTVSADGGTASIQFSSSGKWTAALSNDRASSWLTLSAQSGEKGNAGIVLTAAKSEEPDERSATIRITCGSASASVTLTQKQRDAITQTPSKTQFEAGGGSFTVEVKANIDYSFEVDADWIHQTSTKALVSKTTSFTVDKNEDTRKREGHVTVKSVLGSEVLTIYQDAGEPCIILSAENVAVGSGGGTFTVDVNTNIDVEMTVLDGAEWLGEVTTKAMSTHSYTFHASANEGYDAREGKISFKNADQGVEATVTVTQMQKDALVISQSVYEIGADGGQISIEAATNVELNVEVGQSWVHPVTTKSLQTVSFDFSVDPNPAYDERECVITFSGGSMKQQITVRQDGADGFIADFQEQYNLSAREQTMELKSRSTVDIEAVSDVEWISVTETKALADKSVTLQIAENTTESVRTGKVTLSAPTLGISQAVTVVQVGAGDIYIPDNTFRTLLLAKFDTDEDGILSKEECESVTNINLDALEDPSVQLIESIQGIEYFENLLYLFLRETTQTGALGKLSGTVDLSANSQLWSAYIWGCNLVEKLDIHTCTRLRSLSLSRANKLKEVVFPEKEGQFLSLIELPDSQLGPELDLSKFPDLQYIYLKNNPELKKLWLTTGLVPQQLELDSWCSVGYKGENVFEEVQFKDPVFKEVMLKEADWDGDGKLTRRDMERMQYLNLMSGTMEGIDDSKVITSLEDLSLLKNLEDLFVYGIYGKLTAPLPDCLGELSQLHRICFVDCDVTGTIPESVCKMENLKELIFQGTPITGPLPDEIGRIPHLEQLYLKDCYNLNGPIPESLISGCSYEYLYLSGCNFDDTYIVVPSSRLLEHTARANNFSYIGSRMREYVLPGGGTYYEYPSIYYRSEADGHGAVHADGEAELYHSATKGPGLDIFITGDGFTAENNTVGGTLETYMKHIAEITLSMEPYNKLKDYFNIWLIYAHSEREGSGFSSTEGLKFGSYQVNPTNSSICAGNHGAISDFVKEASGRHESSGTVAVIMNSSHYGGTCYWQAGGIYDAGMSTTYTPAAWMMDLTYVHETLGHGFGHLDDEYDAAGYSPGAYYSAGSWAYNGWGANMDGNDPVRWTPFIGDSRYSTEKIGAYVTTKPVPGGFFGATRYLDFYRPTENSIMKTQWDEGGDRFNAPSREAIWQRVYLLSHPEENWSSWEDYVNNGYKREEFIQFDLTPAPSSAPSFAPGKMRNPELVLPDGRKVRQLPPPTPPVILNGK